MFFRNKQIKISEDFGQDFYMKLTNFLKEKYNANLIKKKEVTMDMNFYDFEIKGKIITVIVEGLEGTFLIGHKKTIRTIIEDLKKEEIFSLD